MNDLDRASINGGPVDAVAIAKQNVLKDFNHKSSSKSEPRKGGVLIIVENLPAPFDRRVWQEAVALNAAGYETSIICPKGKGHNSSYENIDGIHIYRHPQPIDASGAVGYFLEYSFALYWEFYLSLKVLYRHGFDVVHACNPPDLIFLVAAFHKIVFRKKFLFDQHDLNPELYEVKFEKKGFFHKLLQTFERWTFHWADASLATNSTFKELAISRGNMPEDKVWVVKSYPNLERFRRIEVSAAEKRGFKYLAGYVGIMGNQDGVNYLVDAMAHIVHDLKRTDIGCVIIGDGPELENLRAQAEQRNVTDYVQFTGYLSGDDLLKALCACDIGVIPDPPNSCNDKLSMNKVFEYMALGMPFVQFDLKQAKQEAADAALIVEEATSTGLAHGMLELLEDEPRRKVMKAFAEKHAAREFQWEGEVSSLLDAYKSLIP